MIETISFSFSLFQKDKEGTVKRGVGRLEGAGYNLHGNARLLQ